MPKDGRPAPHAGQVVTCRKRDGEHELETVRAIEREYGNCWLCTIEKEARAYPSKRRFRLPPPDLRAALTEAAAIQYIGTLERHIVRLQEDNSRMRVALGGEP